MWQKEKTQAKMKTKSGLKSFIKMQMSLKNRRNIDKSGSTGSIGKTSYSSTGKEETTQEEVVEPEISIK